jgi:hypothetical protein
MIRDAAAGVRAARTADDPATDFMFVLDGEGKQPPHFANPS